MFLVILPPTWKATGIRAKEQQVVWPAAGSLIFIGMQELQQNKEEEKENGKMGSTTAFNGNGMMALILLFMVLSQWSPENIPEAANEKISFERPVV